jgi:hypothetical protein
MRTLLFVPLFLVTFAWADEAADRGAIEKIVNALNELKPSPSLFTSDFDGAAELARLAPGGPKVIISHDVWREATWTLPSHLAVGSVHFVTPDVALVEAAGNGPVLLVMKRIGPDWKIASIRFLVRP